MTGPYFLVEGRDVSCYRDGRAVEKHVEPIDVNDAIYRVFDSEGTEFGLAVIDGKVALTGEPLGHDPAHLRGVIVDYLQTVHAETRRLDMDTLDGVDLGTLVYEFCRVERPR